MIGNWKMYTRAADAAILATSIRNGVEKIKGVEVVLCPPAIWLAEVLSIVGKSGQIKLGVQNMFYEPEGAYTGELSPLMIRDLAQYAIVGHSERREHFGETDLDVNEKVIAALKAGITPIICVGERKKEGLPKQPLNQLEQALLHVPKKNYGDVVVAYEPIWAIGTGNNADPEYVSKVITYLRQHGLVQAPILYGGSINSQNARDYACRPEIDGLLVGGSSIRSLEFTRICNTWSKEKHFSRRIEIREEE
ncbi:MAG: triose-phosphate isomerase [Patescibacteria group bacterium]